MQPCEVIGQHSCQKPHVEDRGEQEWLVQVGIVAKEEEMLWEQKSEVELLKVRAKKNGAEQMVVGEERNHVQWS